MDFLYHNVIVLCLQISEIFIKMKSYNISKIFLTGKSMTYLKYFQKSDSFIAYVSYC